MLQAIRDKSKGIVGGAIVVLLAIPFAFFGIQNYFFGQVDDAVATVNGAEITQGEFQTRFNRERAQMRARFGESLDPGYFDQPMIRRQVLDNLVDEELLTQAVTAAGLAVPPEQVRQEIDRYDVFKVDGRFDPEVYRSLLRQQGMSPQSFEAELRRSLMLRQLPETVTDTGLALASEVATVARLQNQTRSFDYLTVSVEDYLDEVEVSDEEIQAHYEANTSSYMEPERVTIEFLELDAAFLEPTSEPDEAILRERYEDQKLRFVLPERRLASHILVSVPDNADAAALREAREKAAALAERVRGDEAFEDVAREASEDAGSAEMGGDLGWVEEDMMVSAFEDALFAMQPGEISDPVNTSFGFHVIWLREIEESRGKTFEEARFELAQEFRDAEAEREFLELQDRLLDMTFEDQGTLVPAAEALDLELATAGPFDRSGGEGIAADPQIVEAAFSDLVLNEGMNSDPVTLGPNHVVFLRVLERIEATPKALEDVREEIASQLQREKALERAGEVSQDLYAQLQGGDSLKAVAAALGAEVNAAEDLRRSAPGHDAALVREVFSLPRPADAPALHRVPFGGSRFALVELREVADPDPASFTGQQNEALQSRIEQAYGQAEAVALSEALRSKAEISVAEEKILQQNAGF